jgi:hypothetical protein
VVVAGFGVRTERDAVLLVLPGEGDWEFSWCTVNEVGLGME